METSERRMAIMRLLCRRRHETIKNLSFEFDVSERTIRRDIEILSLNEPIYTRTGRYGGGVYIMPDYSMDRMYFKNEECDVLNKVLCYIEKDRRDILSCDEIDLLRKLINDYTKPTIENK